MIETTLAAKCEKADFKKIFEKKGYKFFTKGVYNLNIIGVRRKGNKITNTYDDCLVVIYNTDTAKDVKRIFRFTTLPGKKAMDHPMNIKGTAILVPGQYLGSHIIRLHRGKYKALCQDRPISVYRDNNKDSKYDFVPTYIDNGVFGINIHKAGANSVQVDNWSAGCQVFANANQFKLFMDLCHKQVSNGFGSSFTYTLLTEKDL